jgi:hypothetical protein
MYSHGIGKISNLLNKPLHEFLGLTPTMITTIFFCNVSDIILVDEVLPKIFPCTIKQNNNRFESVRLINIV